MLPSHNMLERNSMKTLLDRIYSQQDQKELTLSRCNLVAVPIDSIRFYYGEPIALDLSHNLITSISPQFITSMASLTKLDLSKNNIRKLPDELGSLEKLVYLDLHQNQLETLPVSLCKLSLLQYLNISNNPFRSPLSDFLKLEAVKKQADKNMNVAQSVINFLSEVARRTIHASGDTNANVVNMDRKRSVSFNSEITESDGEKIEETYPADSDEENMNIPVPPTPRHKRRDPGRQRHPRRQATERQLRTERERTAPATTAKLSKPTDLDLKTIPRLHSILKGTFCLILLVLLLPFLVAMMVGRDYFKSMANDPGRLSSFWGFYQPIHDVAEVTVGCYCRLNVPLLIRGPPPELSFISAILETINLMFSYVCDYFV